MGVRRGFEFGYPETPLWPWAAVLCWEDGCSAPATSVVVLGVAFRKLRCLILKSAWLSNYNELQEHVLRTGAG